MRSIAKLLPLLCLMLSLSTGCSAQQTELKEESEAVTLARCPEPRPEMCTMQVDPVCATRDTGIRCIKAPCPSSELKTYSNACAACSDPAVSGFIPGACVDEN